MSDWGRLGSAVIAERVRLGWRTMAAFAAATGLSSTTIDSIEHGRKESYEPSTIATLEYFLGWRTGSVERILKGMDPLPEDDPDLRALLDAWPRLSPGSRRMLRVLATEGARAEGN